MSKSKIDAKAFIEAVRTENIAEQTRLYQQMQPALMGYLRTRFGAPIEDAEDACQHAFLAFVERMNEEDFDVPQGVFSYLKTSVRNYYLGLVRIEQRVDKGYDVDSYDEIDDQTELLLEEERLKILARCIEELSEEYRSFISHVMRHIELETEKLAASFQMSISNFWTKKSRVVKQLQMCTEKNFSF